VAIQQALGSAPSGRRRHRLDHRLFHPEGVGEGGNRLADCWLDDDHRPAAECRDRPCQHDRSERAVGLGGLGWHDGKAGRQQYPATGIGGVEQLLGGGFHQGRPVPGGLVEASAVPAAGVERDLVIDCRVHTVQ